MSVNKDLMVTLSEAEFDELEKMSDMLGSSKSRVIAQALNMMRISLKEAGAGVFKAPNIQKTSEEGGK